MRVYLMEIFCLVIVMEACQNYTCTQSKNENPWESGSAPGSAPAPGINP